MRKLLGLTIVFLLSLCQLWAQTKEVTGKVTDATGTGLSGVSVKVKGSNVGTSTGNDGTYSIIMPKGLTSLVFSSIGFDDQEVSVKGNVINITMSQTSKNLNEVVITGYGTQEKKGCNKCYCKSKRI